MQQDPKQIILQILDIIGYTDDKDAFTTEFLTLCQQQALGKVIEQLSKDKQDSFQQQMNGVTKPEEAGKILEQYITGEQYQEALRTVSQAAFQDWLSEVIPTLNEEQTEKLQAYLGSLAQLQQTP